MSGSSLGPITATFSLTVANNDTIVLIIQPGSGGNLNTTCTVTGPGSQTWEYLGYAPTGMQTQFFLVRSASAASGNVTVSRTGNTGSPNPLVVLAQVYSGVGDVTAIQVLQTIVVNVRPAVAPSTTTYFNVVTPGSWGVGGFSWYFGALNNLSFTNARASIIGSPYQGLAIADQLFSSTGSQQVFLTWSANASANNTQGSLLLEPQAITVGVTISPSSANVVSGFSQQFTATVTGTTNTAVTWTASPGTIDQTGYYTAPTVTGVTSGSVTATSVADPTVSATAILSIQPLDLGAGYFRPKRPRTFIRKKRRGVVWEEADGM